MGEGGGGKEKGRAFLSGFLSFSSLPFTLPSFPFSPETPDTQANEKYILKTTAFSQSGHVNLQALEFMLGAHQ